MRRISELHYISQPAEDGKHSSSIERALGAGCRWIQLRVKDEPENIVLNEALAARELCDRYGARLIVNDYAMVAKVAAADGLHLGLEDMPVNEARDIVGEQMIIGGTANTYEHILKRITEGVDYIGLGPFRFTKTKKKLSPVLRLSGYIDIFSRLRREQLAYPPIIAIGGIVSDDLENLCQAGVEGVAMSGAFSRNQDSKALVDYVSTCFSNQISQLKF